MQAAGRAGGWLAGGPHPAGIEAGAGGVRVAQRRSSGNCKAKRGGLGRGELGSEALQRCRAAQQEH